MKPQKPARKRGEGKDEKVVNILEIVKTGIDFFIRIFRKRKQ